MPIYSFDCETCEHETEIFTGIASRPTEIECEECGSNAKHRKLNWRPPPKRKNGHLVYGSGTPAEEFLKKERLVQYKCATCSHGNWEWFTGTAPKEIECEFDSCDGKASRVWKVKLDMHWARFPYYDRGLGVTLTSENHRREICRQRGVTPVDGDWDMDYHFAKADKKINEETAVYDDYVDRLENDPAYKDWRKARDDGQVPDMLPTD
tara:strand:+ start:3341 stop:3964 length:624 start_codon:yes stop_codon:yes gene_type:complete